MNVLSNFDCHKILNPQIFERVIIDIAIYHFHRKPSAVIAIWSTICPRKGVDCALFCIRLCKPAKVLEMLPYLILGFVISTPVYW